MFSGMPLRNLSRQLRNLETTAARFFSRVSIRAARTIPAVVLVKTLRSIAQRRTIHTCVSSQGSRVSFYYWVGFNII